METLSILYDQYIKFEAIPDYSYFEARKDNTSTFSIATGESLLLVDHFKRCTFLFHNNPKCNAMFGKPGYRKVPDNFLESFIYKDDIELFVIFVSAINDAVRNDFLKGDRSFYFSFNLLLHSARKKAAQYSFTVMPYLYSPDNKPWVIWCAIEPCDSTISGNLTLNAVKKGARYNFNVDKNKFCEEDNAWMLTNIEKTILQLSAEGFTEKQIAGLLKITISLLKNTKIRMFGKMNVNTIYEAISKAFKSGVIN